METLRIRTRVNKLIKKLNSALNVILELRNDRFFKAQLNVEPLLVGFFFINGHLCQLLDKFTSLCRAKYIQTLLK